MRTHLVERVATKDRLALVSLAVIEAARRYVAARLLLERAAGRNDTQGETVHAFDETATLQDLRDCLPAHSRNRVRR